MIKINNGLAKFEGKLVDILTDYTCITHGLFELLTEECEQDVEVAKNEIQHAFDLALKTKEEKIKEIDELLEGMPEGLGDFFKVIAELMKKKDEE